MIERKQNINILLKNVKKWSRKINDPKAITKKYKSTHQKLKSISNLF